MSKYSKDEFEELILIKELPYEVIGKMYGCSGTNIKKVAKRMGIDLLNRRTINSKETFGKGVKRKEERIFCKNCQTDITHKSKNIYCDRKCHTTYRRQKQYEYFLTSPEEYQNANFSSKVIKNMILKEQDNKCSICKSDSIWNGKHLVLILDHIDGNAANNTRENLRCVCPNCDSQLDTYKSKNKNGARHYYRYRYSGVSPLPSKQMKG